MDDVLQVESEFVKNVISLHGLSVHFTLKITTVVLQ